MRTRLIASLLAAVALALPTAAIADHGGGATVARVTAATAFVSTPTT
jgi:hypothetical protein